MKTSNVGLENLLDQLSEEKINLVVDNVVVQAGWETSCGSGSGSSKSKSSKSHKSSKSCKSH